VIRTAQQLEEASRSNKRRRYSGALREKGRLTTKLLDRRALIPGGIKSGGGLRMHICARGMLIQVAQWLVCLAIILVLIILERKMLTVLQREIFG